MTTLLFWLLATLMAAAALAGLLRPLLRKQLAATTADDGANLALLREQQAQLAADHRDGLIDAAAHRQAQTELARRALDETDGLGAAATASAASPPAGRSAFAIALGLPVMALALYQLVGTPSALLPASALTAGGPAPAPPTAALAQAPIPAISGGSSEPDAAATQAATAPPTAAIDAGAPDVEAMVARLAQRLAAQPDDGPGWQMLARSYTALGRFEEASQAYARAARLSPDDAQLLADQADALAMAQGRSAAGEPTLLVERALKIAPDNLKALAIAGSAALERGDNAAAQAFFQRAERAAQAAQAAQARQAAATTPPGAARPPAP